MKTIGIIGAGQMGSGIAQICATAGYTVKISDLEQSRLDAAVEKIDQNLKRMVARGKLDEADAAKAMTLIDTGTDYAIFGDSDVVIEAATENEEIKRSIFKALVPKL